MRSTFAWLADLLVRLERISWRTPRDRPSSRTSGSSSTRSTRASTPNLQARILPALRELFPNARIYATTHSPFVVASAGEGVVFPIRPDARPPRPRHRRAAQAPAGQSLEWVVEEIFGAETGFVDPWTREALRTHRADIARLRRKDAFGDDDWHAFLARREELMRLNEQVQTVVAMQEVPVARVIEEHLRGAAA